MGMSMKELEDVIKARKASGKHYMFMGARKSASPEYLYAGRAVRIGAMRQAAVYALRPLSGYGGLALLLGQPRPGTSHPMPSTPVLLWQGSVRSASSAELRQGPSGTGKAVRLPRFESALVALEDGETTVEMEAFPVPCQRVATAEIL